MCWIKDVGQYSAILLSIHRHKIMLCVRCSLPAFTWSQVQKTNVLKRKRLLNYLPPFDQNKTPSSNWGPWGIKEGGVREVGPIRRKGRGGRGDPEAAGWLPASFWTGAFSRVVCLRMAPRRQRLEKRGPREGPGVLWDWPWCETKAHLTRQISGLSAKTALAGLWKLAVTCFQFSPKWPNPNIQCSLYFIHFILRLSHNTSSFFHLFVFQI